MHAPASVITLGAVLCTPLPYARPLMYIRRTLAGEDGGTRTDQGFYGHGGTTRGPAQRTTGQSEEPEPLEGAL